MRPNIALITSSVDKPEQNLILDKKKYYMSWIMNTVVIGYFFMNLLIEFSLEVGS